LLYCTVLEWVQDYCYERFKSLLIIKPPVETANNKVTALQYTFSLGFTPWAMYSLV
jgi:choline-glycine betaine transporter